MNESQTAKPVVSSRRSAAPSRRNLLWVERLLVGGALALALFSLEAGLAHIGLAREAGCRAALPNLRVAPPAGSECISELGLAVLGALARGPAGLLLPGGMTLAAWALSGGLYAIVGGACAQLSSGRAAVTYLGIHGLVLMVVSFLMFIGPHLIV